MEEDEFQQLSNKMNVLISLMINLKDSLAGATLLKDKIYFLDDLGLKSNKEIALIAGTSESTVAKEKSLRKKNGWKKIVWKIGYNN